MKVTRCDECSVVLEDEEDDCPAYNWIEVQWGLEREHHKMGTYCTAACALTAIEGERDAGAERDLAALEEVND